MKEFHPPKIDGRRRADLRREAIERARAYVPELDPDADDVGTALLGLFAELAEDVTERLDRTPEKHRVAFFDELGFDRDPPQPARLPVVFTLAENLRENVPIPSGTQAISEPEGDEVEQPFEIAEDEGFEATPAHLRDVYSAHPDGDAVFEHQAGPQAGLEPRLFGGENKQSHVLYLGHPDFFTLKRGAGDDPDGVPEFDVRIVAPERADVFEALQWSYYGTQEVGGESVERWHQLGLRPSAEGDSGTTSGRTVLRFALPAGGEFVETTLPALDPDAPEEAGEAAGTQPPTPPDVTEIESRWIKCEPPADGNPRGLFDVRVEQVSLELPGIRADLTGTSLESLLGSETSDSQGHSGTSGSPSSPASPGTSGPPGANGSTGPGSLGGVMPDMLLANDVPLPTNDDGAKIFPFGEVPRPLDTFYVGSEDVLTKKGDRILLVFPGMEDDLTPEAADAKKLEESAVEGSAAVAAEESGESGSQNSEDPPPILNLSWEYWNGSGWDYLPEVDDHFSGGWVAFDLPRDAEGTTVSGHDGHWIRARVLEDGYVKYEEKSSVWEMIAEVVPRFDEAWLFYLDDLSADPSGTTDAPTGDPVSEGAGLRESSAEMGEIGEGEVEDAATAGESASGEEHAPLTRVRGAVSTSPQQVVAYNNLSYGGNEARRLRGTTTEERGGWFAPFERLPDETQAVYLGFDRALDDGPIQVLFSLKDKIFPDEFHPRVRWERCGDGSSRSWVRLSTTDGTDSFTRRGVVGLVFSEPTTACELFGRERHWIRARLVGNRFQSTAEPVSERSGSAVVVSALDSENGEVIVRNSGPQQLDLAGYRFGSRYAPSVEVGRPLPNDAIVPPGESLVIGARARATSSVRAVENVVPARAETNENTLALLTPETEVVMDVEAEDDHDRARRADDDPTANESLPGEAHGPCGAMEPLVLAPSPIPTESPPVLRGVYVNAGWADNVRTVTGEVLGSSDGNADQEFSFADRPVTDESVWVEELSALGEDARETLKEERPEHVDERVDDSGAVTAFRVRWTRVADFVGSGDDDRHYVLDRTAGKVTFGDGTRGRIPPRGEDNVSADYRTGGGVDGNVREGTVTALTSTLPFVESVTNPEPGDGGADAERRDEALERAARTLKDRNRAVTRGDFERLAKAASRGIERVRCVPGMDRSGAPRVGWVTVLLVPRSNERKPTLTPELKSRVEEKLLGHAPAPLSGPTSERIVVRGPSYVEVAIDTDLVANADVSSVTAVEETAETRLEAFLHPLSGGPQRTGWRFGELPCVSDFYALLEGVEGVDHVERLEVTLRGRDRGYTVTDDDRRPEVREDTLVFSGTHTVQAESETSGVNDPPERDA